MRREWTMAEIITMLEHRATGLGGIEIGRILKRTKRSVDSKLETLTVYCPMDARLVLENGDFHVARRENSATEKPLFVPEYVEDRRDQLINAMDLRDLTGILQGDPPPGFSALDRRRWVAA